MLLFCFWVKCFTVKLFKLTHFDFLLIWRVFSLVKSIIIIIIHIFVRIDVSFGPVVLKIPQKRAFKCKLSERLLYQHLSTFINIYTSITIKTVFYRLFLTFRSSSLRPFSKSDNFGLVHSIFTFLDIFIIRRCTAKKPTSTRIRKTLTLQKNIKQRDRFKTLGKSLMEV